MARTIRTQAERDQDQLDSYVNSYNRKLATKRRLDEKRSEMVERHENALRKIDEKLSPINADLEGLHKRVVTFAELTGADVDDLIEPIGAGEEANDEEFDEAGAFSEENDKPALYPEYEAQLDESFVTEEAEETDEGSAHA